jgi:hypothetical protein
MDIMDMDRAQANHGERVEVADSSEPNAAGPDTPKAQAWLTIGQRLAAIRDECYGIHKDAISKEKDGKKWTEKGHIVEVILSEFRPLLSKYGVDMTPNLIERAYAGNRCDIIVDFRFECLDADEWDVANRPCSRVIRWAGAGTDNGDKAFAKAGTNALKEMLKKVFLITDRDDAREETDSIEHETEGGAAKAKKATEERARTLQAWATTFKRALETAKDQKEIDRLKRENREQLDSDDLPEVTRQFFNELIAERKAELET